MKKLLPSFDTSKFQSVRVALKAKYVYRKLVLVNVQIRNKTGLIFNSSLNMIFDRSKLVGNVTDILLK
jgi:hypothetical protein